MGHSMRMPCTGHFRRFVQIKSVVNLDPVPEPLNIFLLTILTENIQISIWHRLKSKQKGDDAVMNSDINNILFMI